MQVSILYAGRVEAGFGIKSLKTPLSDKVRLLNSYRFRNGVYAFNGEYTDKPLLISSSSVAFYISNYNSFEITKQIEPNVVSLSVYFMSESLVCYVAKFVFIMKKSAYENKIFR